MICEEEFENLYSSSDHELSRLNTQYLNEVRCPLRQGLILSAVRRRDIVALEKFLKRGLSFKYKPSPFHIAVGRCDLPSVALFLRYGAHVNAKTTFGLVPLDYLLDVADLNPDSEDKCEVLRLLLTKNLHLFKVHKYKLKKLHSSPKILKMLLDAGLDTLKCQPVDDNKTLLARILPNSYDVVSDKRLEVIKLLIAHATDLNDQWYLSWACMNNQLEVAKLLLEACPVSVLEYHDLTDTFSRASLQKCAHPLCSTIHTFMEFGEDCTPCLKLLLQANVRLQFKDDDHTSEEYRHKSPIDQFNNFKSVHWLPLDVCRLLLKCGLLWVHLSQGLSEEQICVLTREGFGLPSRLEDIAKHTIRYSLGPGNMIKKVDSLEIPKYFKDVLNLQNVL